jgi:WD40 repeat protein
VCVCDVAYVCGGVWPLHRIESLSSHLIASHLISIESNGNRMAIEWQASASPLMSCTWNAHSPHELLVGGVQRSLQMFDLRLLRSAGGSGGAGRSVVWRAAFDSASAHTAGDSITDVSWSGLVPHWFAAACSDGSVRVWDVRYGAAPVRVLQAHTNGVNRVCFGWDVM